MKNRSIDLAVRAILAFGMAIWISSQLSPVSFDALLPFYERAIHGLDDHYQINLSLTHQTGQDKVGSDLVLLAQATVNRAFIIFNGDITITLHPGQVLKSSATTGLLMQPAITLLSLVLGWPAQAPKNLILRLPLGLLFLLIWILFGIPLSLWIYLQDIPIRAYVPSEMSLLTTVGKVLQNGGGVMVGALFSAAAISLADRLSGRLCVNHTVRC